MRYFIVVSAVAIAIMAVQAGAFTTDTGTSSVVSVDILELQKQVGYNLPVLVIDDPV